MDDYHYYTLIEYWISKNSKKNDSCQTQECWSPLKCPDYNSSPSSPWFLREGNLQRLSLLSKVYHIHSWKENVFSARVSKIHWRKTWFIVFRLNISKDKGREGCKFVEYEIRFSVLPGKVILSCGTGNGVILHPNILLKEPLPSLCSYYWTSLI